MFSDDEEGTGIYPGLNSDWTDSELESTGKTIKLNYVHRTMNIEGDIWIIVMDKCFSVFVDMVRLWTISFVSSRKPPN